MVAKGETVDDASAEAILVLQTQDLQSLSGLVKGKQREGQLSDPESALTLQLAEHEQALPTSKDRRVCLSLAEAVERDAALLTAAQSGENQAQFDRAMTHTLSGRAPPRADQPTLDLTEEIVAQLSAINVAGDDGGPIIGYADSDAGEGSSMYFSVRAREENTKRIQCTACFDLTAHFEAYTADCSHVYCTNCLKALFDHATVDARFYPVRCCKNLILLDDVRQLLGRELCVKFETKAKEWETPNRIYCPVPRCSAFIQPTEEGKTYGSSVSCQVCGQGVCLECKEESHEGECGEDANATIIQQLRSSGLQQCVCGHMIELTRGCNHITCLCKHQFCYVCSRTWKTCECPQFDEARLYDQAQDAVDRVELGLKPFERVGAIALMTRALRRRHACDHVKWWKKHGGSHDCEMCDTTTISFILRCPRCNMLACIRCVRNRVE